MARGKYYYNNITIYNNIVFYSIQKFVGILLQTD